MAEEQGVLSKNTREVIKLVREFARLDAALGDWMAENNPTGQVDRRSAEHYRIALAENPDLKKALVALDRKARKLGLSDVAVVDPKTGTISPYMLGNYPKVWENIYVRELSADTGRATVVKRKNPYNAVTEKVNRLSYNAGFEGRKFNPVYHDKGAYAKGKKDRKESAKHWFVTEAPKSSPNKFGGQDFVDARIAGPFDSQSDARKAMHQLLAAGGKVDPTRQQYIGIS